MIPGEFIIEPGDITLNRHFPLEIFKANKLVQIWQANQRFLTHPTALASKPSAALRLPN